MNQDNCNIESIRKASEEFLNIILSETVTIGEMPAPTFSENQRAEYIANRFSEAVLQDCFMDEKSNVMGTITGSEGTRNIIVTSHMDNLNLRENYHINITKDHMVGPFIENNALALAVLVSLPFFIDKLNLSFKSNITLLTNTRSLGKGNNDGLKYYLSSTKTKYNAGITLENITLGRLNYQSIGMLRCEITCILPENFKWERYGAFGTIIPMSEIINKIGNIELPKIPVSSLILGSVNGGFSYNNISRKTKLCFEIRSESFDILKRVREQIRNITDEVSARSGVQVSYDIVSEREPGGIEIGHEIVQKVRSVFNSLMLKPDFFPTVSQLSVLKDFGVPCVTLGITSKDSSIATNEAEEALNIGPIPIGVAQLIASLIEIDNAQEKQIKGK
ncbi:MAG TPA: peptidase [Lentisphaeria bacterium]|nr:MAG: hypothetical protein A2X47_00190 [Lentisphaerae bacterium GWF2_38_69]HBM14886.1 peptidase [Lentisphaeria bacterium]